MNAIILAAGLGTRLRPLTNDKPKALVELEGKPMLEHLMLKMKRSGFKHVVINVHYKGETIMDFINKNNGFGIKTDISDEREMLLDTGGGIAHALSYFDDDNPVLVHNVDIICNADLTNLYESSKHNDVLLMVQKRQSSRMLYFDDAMNLSGWMNLKSGEKKSPFENFIPENFSSYAFSGIHVINTRMIQCLKKQTEAFPLIPFYLSLADKMNIKGTLFSQNEEWVDAGTTESLYLAEQIIKNNY